MTHKSHKSHKSHKDCKKHSCRKVVKNLKVCKDLEVKGKTTLDHLHTDTLCLKTGQASTFHVGTLSYDPANPPICPDDQGFPNARAAREGEPQILVTSDFNVQGTVFAGTVEGVELLQELAPVARSARAPKSKKTTVFKNNVLVKEDLRVEGDLVVDGDVRIYGCLKVSGCIHECYDSDDNSCESGSESSE
jgi:hypothetical protein